MKAYKLQLLQALTPLDKTSRFNFCTEMQSRMEEDDTFSHRLIFFSDEATFQLSGKVNCHNVQIWGTAHPHTTTEHERDSPKQNVFCAIFFTNIYRSSFFAETTVSGFSYLDMLENWLFPQLNQDSDDHIFQQDGALPHFYREVREVLNHVLPQRWIRRYEPH
jgi:hypothetical protein